MTKTANITVDAAALQERDDFRSAGWLKLIAPAKVNLHLAIGERRADGYHSVATVMHTLALHDVVYMRATGAAKTATAPGSTPSQVGNPPRNTPSTCDVVSAITVISRDSTIEFPEIAPEDNLAARAVSQLAAALGSANTPAIELRIEKSIPVQAGLGGGSADAAAALVGAARLWGLAPDDQRIEQTARRLGADVAFFLHGSCAYLEGAGDEFVHALAPSKQAVVLVKPDGGVPTAEAYRRFDEAPTFATAEQAAQVAAAENGTNIALFNNLAPASESIMPTLAAVRGWLVEQPHVQDALLSGSGAATFALCDSFTGAVALSSAARARGWWARATSLAPVSAIALADAHGAQGDLL